MATSYLCPETYPEANADFIRRNNVKLYHFGLEGNKVILVLFLLYPCSTHELTVAFSCQEPLTDMSTEVICSALKVVLGEYLGSQLYVPLVTWLVFLADQKNHPLLIHCHKGKVRQGPILYFAVWMVSVMFLCHFSTEQVASLDA